MRQPASRKNNSGNMEVCVVKPTSVDDSREITETLLSGRTVILNLEGMDLEICTEDYRLHFRCYFCDQRKSSKNF